MAGRRVELLDGGLAPRLQEVKESRFMWGTDDLGPAVL